MVGAANGQPKATTAADLEALDRERARREHAGPAGGLLIAVGTSLILWAVIAQAARFFSSILFR